MTLATLFLMAALDLGVLADAPPTPRWRPSPIRFLQLEPVPFDVGCPPISFILQDCAKDRRAGYLRLISMPFWDDPQRYPIPAPERELE